MEVGEHGSAVKALVKYGGTVDLQSVFGLHVHSYTNWLRPRTPPPPHLGSYTRALVVSQDRRHLFETLSDRNPRMYLTV
jgi:hypothetical protein